jgi:ATP-binding cassette subfamily B protein
MGLMIGMSTLITILIGSLDVVHHVEGASVGKIAEFVLYIQMLTFPVSAIGWTASMTQRAAASQKRINEFLETPSSISDSPEAKDYSLKGNLKFKQLNFTYKNTGIHAVQDFSLEIKKGQKIAIIGKTGSGKTTIAQLLLRMYEVDNGSLEFDDTYIQQIRLKSLRTQISYVPQDNFLFSDSIENNIKFGKPDASFIEVENAAKAAGIFNEIMKFENGFQTIVGERGITLSGGQKQRISIARALIKKPEIVIFDDCLSAVDARTEKQILENLNEALAEKTAIIITHRIFSLFRFDKIIVMDHGKIAESGTHQELLLKNGLYAEMYKKQQMSENEGDET